MIALLDRHLGAQPVDGQPAHQVVGRVGAAVDEEAVGAVARHQEVEQDLALRREQRARPGFACRNAVEVDGEDVLQEVFGLRPGHGKDGAVGEGNDGHEEPRLAIREAIT